MGIRFRVFEDFVPCIRPADSHEKVVLRSEKSGNMPLTLAAVFSSDQHVNQPAAFLAIQSQVGSGTHNHVGLGASIGLDDPVRALCQASDAAFGFISGQLAIGSELAGILLALLLSIAASKFFDLGFQMYVEDLWAIRSPDCMYLLDDAHGINHNYGVVWKRLNNSGKSACNPFTFRASIQQVANALKIASTEA